MSPPWQPLYPLTASTTLPPLLVSAEFTSNAYCVSITDLTYLWSESLDRRNIIKRSLDVDTSIDPSEDTQQMSVFLDKIHSALRGAENTSLSILTHPKAGSEEPPPLDLNVTVVLPKSLRPLKWPLHLKPLSQTIFSSKLLFPILRAHNARVQELGELVDLLKDKDHVIQKLIEKLEATGAELGNVFPGAAGKGGRNVPRKLAEGRVRGLRAFDAEEWRKGTGAQEKHGDTEEVTAAVAKVFQTSDDHVLTHNANRSSSEGWTNWWTQVKNSMVEFSAHRVEGNTTTKDGAHSIQGKQKVTAQDNDDDFQVQPGPPRRQDSMAPNIESSSSLPTIPLQTVNTDSTDDQDDLDGPSQYSAIPDSFPDPAPKQQVKKLGAIGRSKPDPEAPAKLTTRAKTSMSSLSIAAKRKPFTTEDDDDDETATEDEEDMGQPTKLSPLKRENPTPLAEPKRPSTLGLIDSNSKRTTLAPPLNAPPTNARLFSPPPPPPPPPQSPTRPLHVPKPKPKLGIIGRKGKATELKGQEMKAEEEAPSQDIDGDGIDDILRGRGDKEMQFRVVQNSDGEKQKEKLRETSLERADRKREELKRELEAKAKVPVKKKRKF